MERPRVSYLSALRATARPLVSQRRISHFDLPLPFVPKDDPTQLDSPANSRSLFTKGAEGLPRPCNGPSRHIELVDGDTRAAMSSGSAIFDVGFFVDFGMT